MGHEQTSRHVRIMSVIPPQSGHSSGGLNQPLSECFFSLGKLGPEHRQTAARLRFGRFILQNIPMICHSNDIAARRSFPKQLHEMRELIAIHDAGLTELPEEEGSCRCIVASRRPFSGNVGTSGACLAGLASGL